MLVFPRGPHAPRLLLVKGDPFVVAARERPRYLRATRVELVRPHPHQIGHSALREPVGGRVVVGQLEVVPELAPRDRRDGKTLVLGPEPLLAAPEPLLPLLALRYVARNPQNAYDASLAVSVGHLRGEERLRNAHPGEVLFACKALPGADNLPVGLEENRGYVGREEFGRAFTDDLVNGHTHHPRAR